MKKTPTVANDEKILAEEIRLGKWLIAEKQKLKHGEWKDWLTRNFGGSQRTAQVYMKLARNSMTAITTRQTLDHHQ